MIDNAKLIARIDEWVAIPIAEDVDEAVRYWLRKGDDLLRDCRAALSLPAPQGARMNEELIRDSAKELIA